MPQGVNPIIVFGLDEIDFNQFIYNGSIWIGPDGERYFSPKSNGLVCRELGARAVITTKFHAEYADEGIEYSWGYSKALYRKYSLTSRKGKANFDKLFAK